MDPDFPNRPPGALDPDQMLARVRRRGSRLRRRRRLALTAIAVATAGAAAGLALTIVPGSSPHQVVSTGPTPSTASTSSASCPPSDFVVQAPTIGLLPATPDFTAGTYLHLAVGQTATLFSNRAPGDESIELTRGVSNDAFAVSVWSHGPKPLIPVTVLDAPALLYPAGAGSNSARVPFRYPQGGPQSDPCDRYQLEASGLDDNSLIQLAENIETGSAAVEGWPHRLILWGGVGSITSLGNVVYAQQQVIYDGDSRAGPAPVVAIDATKLVTKATSQPLPLGELVTAGNTLWLLTRQSPVVLYELSPETLAIQRSIPFGSADRYLSGVAGSARNGLWLAVGPQLVHLNPTTATVVAHAASGASAYAISTDGADRLYDVATGSTGDMLEQRNAATGALERAVALPDVPGSARLAAIPAGVWVTYRTGTYGGSFLYAASNLAVIAPPASAPLQSGRDLFGGADGSSLTLSGGAVWVWDLRNFTCADPATGRVRATEPIPQASDVTTAGHLLFGETGNGLEEITPPAACWGT